MHTPDTLDSTAVIPAKPATSSTRPDRRGSSPAPGEQPTSSSRPTLTAVQRRRCQAANRIGAALTEAARDGRHPHDTAATMGMSLHDIPEGRDIVARAAKLAADPPAGALRIGRTRHGDPVAVVLHAETWSLVLWPHRGQPGTPTTAGTWTLLDSYYGDDRTDYQYIDLCFDYDQSVLGLAWTEMVTEILTLTV